MRLYKNVLVILRGSLLGQAISYAALPLLARLYLPEDFGRYQIFLTVVNFLLLAASLRLELGILSAESDDYAFSLARLCVAINAGLAAVTLLCCGAIAWFAPLTAAKLGAALWFLPGVLLAGGAFQTVTFLLLRAHAFRGASVSRGVQAFANAGTALGLGAARAAGIGLVLADLVGRASAVLYAWASVARKDSRYGLRHQGTYAPGHLLRKFWEYPLISLPGALLDGIGGSMTPVLMLGVFGTAAAGQYAMVDRSLAVPIAVIAQAVSQVFMASFSSAFRTDRRQAAALFRYIVFTHLKVGLIPAALLALLAPWAFELVFGGQWHTAGRIAQIMTPLLLISFMVTPVTSTLLLIGRLRLNTAWYIARVTLVLSAWLMISRLHLTPLPAIAIHVAVNVVAYAALLALMYRSLSSIEPALASGSG